MLNGPYTLADLDLVINSLRLTGSVPDNTTEIPPYLVRPANFDNARDVLGHGLLEIYLNPHLNTSNRVTQQIKNALKTLVTPNKKSDSGFFSVTLTWNGSGDVDLHVWEPNGTHIYYANKVGRSGYLDVDNTISFGPEHFVALCDPSSLATGVYTISVANYRGADGKVATIQVATWNNGVIATRSTVLEGDSGSTSSRALFKINISYNSTTEKYSAEIL